MISSCRRHQPTIPVSGVEWCDEIQAAADLERAQRLSVLKFYRDLAIQALAQQGMSDQRCRREVPGKQAPRRDDVVEVHGARATISGRNRDLGL